MNDTVYPVGGGGNDRVRSMSMNAWMNASPTAVSGCAMPVTTYRLYAKSADLSVPGAANLRLYIDENPYSINDAFFLDIPSDTGWVDCPSSYHDGACGMAFCDGHAQIKKWTDRVVLDWKQSASLTPTGTRTPDLLRFLPRTTPEVKQLGPTPYDPTP
jgi:prepilin-type processing-associated H-X9-DG protein